MTRAILTALLLLVFARGGLASELERGEEGLVVEVVDGDTVVLDSGLEVRLVGVQAPKLPLGRPGFETWPLAEAAKATLEKRLLGRRVTLAYGGRRRDRHGRALAHLYADEGSWIQGEILDAGLARVYSFRDNRALVAEMLSYERAARAARRGIWNDPFYRILGPDEAEHHIGGFRVVEGRVLDAAIVKGRGYLNFGRDWRTDFTVSVAPRDRRLFEAEGIDITELEGSTVRVRGWLRSFNGPMIEATHPEQIEVFD